MGNLSAETRRNRACKSSFEARNLAYSNEVLRILFSAAVPEIVAI
jgi:hypothetical protein